MLTREDSDCTTSRDWSQFLCMRHGPPQPGPGQKHGFSRTPGLGLIKKKNELIVVELLMCVMHCATHLPLLCFIC